MGEKKLAFGYISFLLRKTNKFNKSQVAYMTRIFHLAKSANEIKYLLITLFLEVLLQSICYNLSRLNDHINK